MDFFLHHTTNSGVLYVLDLTTIGISHKAFSTKSEYQRRGVKLLLDAVVGEHELMHTEKGAPQLKNSNLEISISHTEHFVAVYLSEHQPVGIDIELMNRAKKLELGKDYFVNEVEQLRIWTIDELYIIWNLKEAIFKEKKGCIPHIREAVITQKIEEDLINYTLEGELKEAHFLIKNELLVVFT